MSISILIVDIVPSDIMAMDEKTLIWCSIILTKYLNGFKVTGYIIAPFVDYFAAKKSLNLSFIFEEIITNGSVFDILLSFLINETIIVKYLFE
jgi:hypothetical protein